MSEISDNSLQDQAIVRWRLVLGQFADKSFDNPLGNDSQQRKMDKLLDYLYNREYSGRGIRKTAGDGANNSRSGGSEDSSLTVPDWLHQVRELFPNDTVEILQKHALDKYGMTELVNDPEVMEKLEPNYELLKTVLSFRGMMNKDVLEVARKIIRQVVEELRRKLASEIRQVLWGRLNRLKRSRLKVFKNLDWKRTIRSNLKNYDNRQKTLILESLHFSSRIDRHLPWQIIMAVDCSGSMLDSVIYSAVMAGIFKSLPSMNVNLIAFDTNIIDLSDVADDPTEVLLSVQLGGGTDIHRALVHCESLVVNPHRTIVVFVTDFFEGGSLGGLLASIKRMKEAGIKVLGLAALDQNAKPSYDRATAQSCVDAGAEVAALTPQRLAEWIGKILS